MNPVEEPHKVNLVSGNGSVPSGNKSLLEPKLTQIYVASWCYKATMSQRILNAEFKGHKQGDQLIRTLRWRHNDHAGVSNHQPHGCLLNRLFRRKSKETSKLRVTGLCVGNSPGTGEFPAQMASYAENVSIWWRHHDLDRPDFCSFKLLNQIWHLWQHTMN